MSKRRSPRNEATANKQLQEKILAKTREVLTAYQIVGDAYKHAADSLRSAGDKVDQLRLLLPKNVVISLPQDVLTSLPGSNFELPADIIITKKSSTDKENSSETGEEKEYSPITTVSEDGQVPILSSASSQSAPPAAESEPDELSPTQSESRDSSTLQKEQGLPTQLEVFVVITPDPQLVNQMEEHASRSVKQDIVEQASTSSSTDTDENVKTRGEQDMNVDDGEETISTLPNTVKKLENLKRQRESDSDETESLPSPTSKLIRSFPKIDKTPTESDAPIDQTAQSAPNLNEPESELIPEHESDFIVSTPHDTCAKQIREASVRAVETESYSTSTSSSTQQSKVQSLPHIQSPKPNACLHNTFVPVRLPGSPLVRTEAPLTNSRSRRTVSSLPTTTIIDTNIENVEVAQYIASISVPSEFEHLAKAATASINPAALNTHIQTPKNSNTRFLPYPNRTSPPQTIHQSAVNSQASSSTAAPSQLPASQIHSNFPHYPHDIFNDSPSSMNKVSETPIIPVHQSELPSTHRQILPPLSITTSAPSMALRSGNHQPGFPISPISARDTNTALDSLVDFPKLLPTTIVYENNDSTPSYSQLTPITPTIGRPIISSPKNRQSILPSPIADHSIANDPFFRQSALSMTMKNQINPSPNNASVINAPLSYPSLTTLRNNPLPQLKTSSFPQTTYTSSTSSKSPTSPIDPTISSFFINGHQHETASATNWWREQSKKTYSPAPLNPEEQELINEFVRYAMPRLSTPKCTQSDIAREINKCSGYTCKMSQGSVSTMIRGVSVPKHAPTREAIKLWIEGEKRKIAEQQTNERDEN